MKRLFIVLIGITLLSACGDSENAEAKKTLPQVDVVKVKVENVPIYREYVGQIYGFVDIPIRARVSGFLEGIHFEEGRRVTKGQLLYLVDEQPYQADVAAQKSKLAEAKTELVRAKNELVRYEELIKTNAVSQSDYDATKAEAEAAEASVKAAEANVEMAEINLGYCKIMSPIDGLIGKTEAKVGEFVGKDPNPVILNTVSKISQVRVNFFLTESDYLRIAREFSRRNDSLPEDEQGDTELQLILADGSTHKYKGKVDFVNREVDAMTGSMLVQASFPNPDHLLRPGQYGKVKIQMDLVKDAMLVPQKCIQELQGQYSVFIVNGENKVEAKPIEIGDRIGDYWLVKKGIQASDKVIIAGFQMVRSGVPVQASVVEFKSQAKPN